MKLNLHTLTTSICILLSAHSAFGRSIAPEPGANTTTYAQPLKIVFTEFPPYTYTNQNGDPKVYFVDLISKLLQQQDIPHSFSSHPTARIHFQLKSGEADIYLGPQGVPNLQQHIWSVPLPDSFTIRLFLWRKPSTTHAKSITEIHNQSLAIINGFGYGGILQKLDSTKNKVHIIRSSGHGNALKMLISGRADYLLDYLQPVNTELSAHPNTELLKHPILDIEVAFMVSRNTDNSRELFELLGSAVTQHYRESPAPPPQPTD